MEYESWFDTNENRTMLAICARKLISNIGIGGTIWGLINIVLGIIAMQTTVINVGIVILGIMMLGMGIRARKNPSIGILLGGTIITILLFLWNLGISILNFLAAGAFDPRGLIFPIIFAVVFSNNYRRLRYIKDNIASIQPDKIKAAKQICKTLLKKKLKDEPTIIQTHNRRCRAELMEDKAFFIQRDLMRAFVGSRDNIRNVIVNSNTKKLKMNINHPLDKLTYHFDKKNSEKLKNWLSAGVELNQAQSI